MAEAPTGGPCQQFGVPVARGGPEQDRSPVPLAVGGAALERDAVRSPSPHPSACWDREAQRWGNQSAILSESGLWQAAPTPRASLTQPAGAGD